jgi:hypothetical protein
MGSSQAKPTIFIKTEAPSYLAGSEASGVVYVHIPKELPTNTLWIIIKGKEQCSWNPVNESRNDRYRGRHSILKVRIPLYRWTHDTIPKGEYSFPFNFILPIEIPGSFHIRTSNYEAKISYSIKAEVWADKKKAIKDSVPFIVKQALTNVRYSVTQQQSIPLVVCGCLSRGSAQINLNFDKNAYLITETPRVNVQVDCSNTSQQVKNLVCSLTRYLYLTSQGGNTFSIPLQIFRLNLDKLPPSGALMRDSGIDVRVPLPDYNQVLENASTTLGTIIKCEYIFEVKCNFGFLCNSTGAASGPVVIYPEERIPRQSISVPPDWVPTQFPMFNIPSELSEEFKPSAPLMDRL